MDSILQVTLFFKDQNIFLKPAVTYAKYVNNSISVVNELASLNIETTSVTFFFMVVENNSNCSWEGFIQKLFTILLEENISKMLPSVCFLSAVAVKKVHPYENAPISKSVHFQGSGLLKGKGHVPSEKLFSLNLSNKMLVTKKSEHIIKIPKISVVFQTMENTYGGMEAFKLNMASFCQVLEHPILLQAGLSIRLVLKTAKESVPGLFWPIYFVSQGGFSAARKWTISDDENNALDPAPAAESFDLESPDIKEMLRALSVIEKRKRVRPRKSIITEVAPTKRGST